MSEPAIDADAFNAFEAAGWERQAATYESFFGAITARLIESLLDAADVGAGTRLLDVATGPGHAAAKGAERGATAVGVDVADAMLALARERYPDLDFRRGDAEALPFPDGSFDAVVANFLLLHLGHPERAAAELARVLAPNGRLAATVWDSPERCRVLGVFLDAVAEAGAQPPEGLPVGPPFFRFADDEEFARLLRDQGLTGIRVRTVSFLHPVASADELWRGMLAGTVRTSALIRRQGEDMQRRIRAALATRLAPYVIGDRLELPVSVKLGCARRPPA